MGTGTLELLAEARIASRTGAGARLRTAAGLSQSELARAADVRASTVHRWESGDRKPSGPAALRYAETLRVLKRVVPTDEPDGRPVAESNARGGVVSAATAPPRTHSGLLHSIPTKGNPVARHLDEVALLRDVMARVTRALEALADGERELGEQVLDDLRHELWLAIETAEKTS